MHTFLEIVQLQISAGTRSVTLELQIHFYEKDDCSSTEEY